MGEDEAHRQQEELFKGKFDLEDFRKQIVHVKNMGSMSDLMKKIPGLNQSGADDLGGIDVDEEIKRIEGMIDSMTLDERRDPSLIDNARRRRIAAGSGADLADVSGLVKQFDTMAAVVKQMAQMNLIGKIKTLNDLGKTADDPPRYRSFFSQN